MTKVLSFALSAVTVLALLASCAPVADQLDPAITLASSDAQSKAEWLDGRLEEIPDDVVLGIGSSAEYGVDMSGFEADGYIVREMNGEVLIFGASADGLDRAVRKYAKAAEINQTANLDEVYHEGPRVKKLTIGGHDISAFAIVYSDVYFENAAVELQRLIGIATGVTVPVSTAEVQGPVFSFVFVHDDNLTNVGHTYTVTEDGVLFECSDKYKQYSGIYAVYRFLENELDWFGISSMEAFLSEADHVDIHAGTAVMQNQLFKWLNMDITLDNPAIQETTDAKYGIRYGRSGEVPYGGVGVANHGMQKKKIAGEMSTSPGKDWVADQPCYLDEEFYEVSLRDVVALIENYLAAGLVIGETFSFVDLGAGDNGEHCVCNNCKKLYKQEANAKSAAVVQWANRLSEEISSNDRYKGLVYQIFAYAGTEKPPRTIAPNEFVYVTFCTTGGCFNHALHGEDCTYTVWSPGGGTLDDSKNYNYIKGWSELTPNVYVWAYHYGHMLMSVSYVHTVYDDFKAYRDLGVQGLYWNSTDQGMSANYFGRFLWGELQWNADITDEEFEELYDRALQCFYGDAWEEVKLYFEKQGDIYTASGCFSDWITNPGISPTINIDVYAENFDLMFETLEEAIPLAENAKQEARLISLQCNNIYKGCLASYYPAYDAYDDELIAELNRRYDLMFDRTMSFGLDLTKSNWTIIFSHGVNRDMETQFWQFTTYAYVGSWLEYDIQREMPERFRTSGETE